MKLPCWARFVFTLLSQFVKIVLSWAFYVWSVLGLGHSRSPFSSHTLDFYSNDLVLLSQFVKIIYIWVVLDLGCAPKTFPIPIKIRNVPGFFSLAILWSKSMTVVWNGIGWKGPLQIPAKNLSESHFQVDRTPMTNFREFFSQLCAALKYSSCSQIDYLISHSSVLPCFKFRLASTIWWATCDLESVGYWLAFSASPSPFPCH